MHEPDRASTVDIATLYRAVRAAIGVAGVAGDLATAALIEAEQLGRSRFGLELLAPVARGEERCAPPLFSTESEVFGVYDAKGLCAPVAVAATAERLAGTAETNGVAVAVLRGLGGLGRLAPYVRWVAERNLVGLLAVDGPPFVVPHGGNRAVFGTNPIAFGLPASPVPLVADLGAGTLTMAALRDARTTGHLLPACSAVNAAGDPTTDASAAVAALSRGGLTGTLLALLVESLTGGLVGKLPDQQTRTGTFLVFRPATSTPASVGTRLVQALVASGGRAPGDRMPPQDTIVELEQGALAVLDRLVPTWRRATSGR